ncbi:MAG: GNAT family N-acetyltransferase [Planctomycetes bacterium]|nr:GNAT family N-acetyltransferase [Planctomycetota bacterium]
MGTPPPVALRPVTRETFRAVAALRVRPDQEGFVAANAYSIAQASFHPTYRCLGVHAGEPAVGFVLLGTDEETGERWLVRIMVDREHQGKGYGRAALAAALEEFRRDPEAREVFLSVVPENRRAIALYEAAGFRDTGRVEDGERVMRIDLRA